MASLSAASCRIAGKRPLVLLTARNRRCAALASAADREERRLQRAIERTDEPGGKRAVALLLPHLRPRVILEQHVAQSRRGNGGGSPVGRRRIGCRGGRGVRFSASTTAGDRAGSMSVLTLIENADPLPLYTRDPCPQLSQRIVRAAFLMSAYGRTMRSMYPAVIQVTMTIRPGVALIVSCCHTPVNCSWTARTSQRRSRRRWEVSPTHRPRLLPYLTVNTLEPVSSFECCRTVIQHRMPLADPVAHACGIPEIGGWSRSPHLPRCQRSHVWAIPDVQWAIGGEDPPDRFGCPRHAVW